MAFRREICLRGLDSQRIDGLTCACHSLSKEPFMDAPTPHAAASATVALLGVPYDAGSSFLRGPAEAPALLRGALYSDSSNLWTENGTDLGASGALADAGDVALAPDQPGDDASSAAVRAAIEAAARDILARGQRPLVLGGDHSITYPVLRAVRQVYPRLGILHIDAHPDLYDTFEGRRFSHASPFARIMDERLADRLTQVGIRTLNGHQRAQAERFGVRIVDMREWVEAAGRLDQLGVRFDTPVYVSLDLDALDPAFAPGVSHHEAGGLAVREVVTLIQSLNARIIGADVVEYNPRRDPVGITAAAGAKLLKELAARLLAADAPAIGAAAGK
jgi:agmatinase